MKVAFDRLVRPDGIIQLPTLLAGSIVTIILPDVREDRAEGLETLRQVASAEQAEIGRRP